MTKDDLKSLTSTRPIADLTRDLDELRLMASGRGWAILSDALGAERNVAIRALTGSPTSTKEELDFIRASLRSIDIMLGLPAMIELKLIGELQLAAAKEPKTNGA